MSNTLIWKSMNSIFQYLDATFIVRNDLLQENKQTNEKRCPNMRESMLKLINRVGGGALYNFHCCGFRNVAHVEKSKPIQVTTNMCKNIYNELLQISNSLTTLKLIMYFANLLCKRISFFFCESPVDLGPVQFAYRVKRLIWTKYAWIKLLASILYKIWKIIFVLQMTTHKNVQTSNFFFLSQLHFSCKMDMQIFFKFNRFKFNWYIFLNRHLYERYQKQNVYELWRYEQMISFEEVKSAEKCIFFLNKSK